MLKSLTRLPIAIVLFAALACNSCGRTQNVEKTIVLPDSAGISTLELLEAHHDIEYQSTPSGAFVKSIDSVSNSRTAYWLYYINDTAAMTACDKYILKGGEKVEWRYVGGY